MEVLIGKISLQKLSIQPLLLYQANLKLKLKMYLSYKIEIYISDFRFIIFQR